MILSLPTVPRYTDSLGRPIGKATFEPSNDVQVKFNPSPTKDGAPALWNALQYHIPLSPPTFSSPTGSPTLTNGSFSPTSTCSFSSHQGLLGDTLTQQSSVWGSSTAPDRAKTAIGDVGTSIRDARRNSDSKERDLARIRDGHTLDTSRFARIIEEDRCYGLNRIHILRREAMELVRSTFDTWTKVLPSDGSAYFEQRRAAMDVADFMVHLVRLEVLTPNDMATLSLNLLANLRHQDALVLFFDILQTVKCYSLTYSCIRHLKEDVVSKLRNTGDLPSSSLSKRSRLWLIRHDLARRSFIVDVIIDVLATFLCP